MKLYIKVTEIYLILHYKQLRFLRLFILAASILFFAITTNTYSQTRVDSLEYLGNIVRVNFLRSNIDKQLNTFYLNSRFQFIENSDKVYIRLNESFGSTFIRNESRNTRDEQNFNFNAKYNYLKDFSFGLAGNSSLLSDNRTIGGINESAVNYAALYSEIRPIENLHLSPFGGYSHNRQIGTTDYGSLYGLEAILDDLRFSDININSELRFRNDDISPRRNLIRFYTLSVTNNFERNINNNIRTQFSQNRKDFYFEADSITSLTFNVNNNIQSRTETNYHFFDRLSYAGFLEIFSLDIAGGINWKSIDRNIRYKTSELASGSLYDTQIDELKLEFDAVTSYASKFFNGNLRINFYERDEKHQVERFDGLTESIFEDKSELEEQKNNNSTRATLSFNGNLNISKSDILSLSLYQSKLVFDTQSEFNDDDRDELLSILRLRYVKKLNPYFAAFVNFEGTYGHTVYLFASRSSNNNVNRIFRLRTGGDYSGSLIKSYNSFEVAANYTVYDFEDITTNYQSYAFRQLTGIDSTNIKLTKDVSFFTYSYLKISEIGDFDFGEFSSVPTRFLEEIYLEPRFILTRGNSIFSIGFRMFLLNTYNYKNLERNLSTKFLSIGPIAIIDIYAWRNLNVMFRGYYEFISNTNSIDKEQASLSMQVNWNF